MDRPVPFDSEVPPLKARSLPKGASNRAWRVATTQMSFSSRNARCGLPASATRRASRRSSAESDRYGVSAMGEARADRFRHPDGHDRPRGGEFVDFGTGEVGQKRLKTLLDLVRAEPGEGADDLSRLAARRRQLPARRVTQFDRDPPELQPPAAARGEIDLADGVLGGQAQPVGRGAAAGDDGLAPELGERFERLPDARRTEDRNGSRRGACRRPGRRASAARRGRGAPAPGPPPRACPGEGGRPDRSASPRAGPRHAP